MSLLPGCAATPLCTPYVTASAGLLQGVHCVLVQKWAFHMPHVPTQHNPGADGAGPAGEGSRSCHSQSLTFVSTVQLPWLQACSTLHTQRLLLQVHQLKGCFMPVLTLDVGALVPASPF